MANDTDVKKRAVKRPEGKCKDCCWKPIEKEYCLLKDRPVTDEHSCKDGFKKRIKSKEKVITPDPVKSGSLNDEYLDAIATMMIGADEVIIIKDGFHFSIKKGLEKVIIKKEGVK